MQVHCGLFAQRDRGRLAQLDFIKVKVGVCDFLLLLCLIDRDGLSRGVNLQLAFIADEGFHHGILKTFSYNAIVQHGFIPCPNNDIEK